MRGGHGPVTGVSVTHENNSLFQSEKHMAPLLKHSKGKVVAARNRRHEETQGDTKKED